MNTIISKYPYSVSYKKVKRNPKEFSLEVLWDCTIKGGAGVADSKTLVTPLGVATEIDDKGLEILETIPEFQRDVKRGVILVLKGKKSRMVDVDEVAEKELSDNKGDPAMPLTEKELTDAGATVEDDGNIDVSGAAGQTHSVAKTALSNRRKSRK